MNDENEEFGGGSRTALTRTTPVGQHARAAMQFLQDVAEDPYSAPADRVAAVKAIDRASAPPPAKKRAAASRPRVIFVNMSEKKDDASGPNKAPAAQERPAAASATSVQEWAIAQRAPMLRQLIDVMEDENARMPARISAASLILRQSPDLGEAENTVFIYIDEYDGV